MNLSDSGARAIAAHEGMVLEPYNDPAGFTWAAADQKLGSAEQSSSGNLYSVLPYESLALLRSPYSRQPAPCLGSYGGFVHTPDNAVRHAPTGCFPHRKDGPLGSALSLVWLATQPDSKDSDGRFLCASLAPYARASNKRGYDKGDRVLALRAPGQRWLDMRPGGKVRRVHSQFGFFRNPKRHENLAIPSNHSRLLGYVAISDSISRLGDQLVFEGVS